MLENDEEEKSWEWKKGWRNSGRIDVETRSRKIKRHIVPLKNYQIFSLVRNKSIIKIDWRKGRRKRKRRGRRKKKGLEEEREEGEEE